MAREWKPGDVATVTVDGEKYRALRQAAHGSPLWTLERRGPGGYDQYDSEGRVSAARPLAVIDPEDREQVELLAREMGLTEAWYNAAQAALRALANPEPPKPEEPTGLGAVVEDDKGLRWMRMGTDIAYRPWGPVGNLGGTQGQVLWRKYTDLTVVRVLSEGVTP